MASTLLELRAVVLRNLARNDATAVSVADACINYATVAVSLTQMPNEMFKRRALTISGGSDNINLATSLDANGNYISITLLDVIKLYDTTNGYKLHFIPFESWDILIPSGLDFTKYWTIFNNKIFVKTTPTSNLSVMLSYSKLPEKLEEDSDELEFDNLDGQIISLATSISFAMFEETDTATLWTNILSALNSIGSLDPKARSIIEGKKVLLEGIVPSLS